MQAADGASSTGQAARGSPADTTILSKRPRLPQRRHTSTLRASTVTMSMECEVAVLLRSPPWFVAQRLSVGRKPHAILRTLAGSFGRLAHAVCQSLSWTLGHARRRARALRARGSAVLPLPGLWGRDWGWRPHVE